MNKQTIRLALAVDHKGPLKSRHFGDADKYLIYEISNKDHIFQNEEINIYKNFDEEIEHGSPGKGKAIMDLLTGSGVNVLVSRQFGKNIQMVNRLFVPVIVYSEEPAEVLDTLVKHIKWIENELKNNSKAYKLFTVKKGIIKKSIKIKD